MNKSALANLLFVLIPVFGCAFVFSPELIDGALIPRFIFCSVLIFLVVLWMIPKKEVEHNFKLPFINPITGFFVLWLLAIVLSGVNAINFAEYLWEVQKVLLYFTLFLFFAIFLRQKDLFQENYFLRTVVVIVAILLSIGVYQYIHYGATLNSKGMTSVSGMMNNRNLFAEYLALCFPFLIVAGFSLKRAWKGAAIAASLGALIALIILFTRSVYVAVVIVGVITLILVFIMKRKLESTAIAFSGRNKLGFLFALLVFGFGVYALNSLSGNALKERVESVFASDRGSARGRLKVWKVSEQMIEESSFFGVGAGNWKIIFESYGFNQNGVIFTTEPLNDYLGVYCESGLLGFIGYTGMLIAIIILIIRSLYFDKQKISLFQIAVLSGLLIYSVISFFNFPKDRIEHSVMLCFLLAFASLGFPEKQLIIKRKGRFIVLLFFGGLMLFNLGSGIVRYYSEKHLAKALQARESEQWGTVVREIEKAKSIFYSLDPTTTPVIWYGGIAHYTLGELDLAFRVMLNWLIIKRWRLVLLRICNCR